MVLKLNSLIKTGVVCSFVWVVLSEEITLNASITGFLLGISSMGISRLLLKRKYIVPQGSLKYRPSIIIKYISILIKNIYKSGFIAIKKIVIQNVNTNIVEIETSLQSPVNRAILANSITMIPGTVTIEMDNKRIIVLCLEKNAGDMKLVGQAIKGELEDILKRSENFE